MGGLNLTLSHFWRGLQSISLPCPLLAHHSLLLEHRRSTSLGMAIQPPTAWRGNCQQWSCSSSLVAGVGLQGFSVPARISCMCDCKWVRMTVWLSKQHTWKCSETESPPVVSLSWEASASFSLVSRMGGSPPESASPERLRSLQGCSLHPRLRDPAGQSTEAHITCLGFLPPA